MKAINIFFAALFFAQSLFGIDLENSVVKIYQTRNLYSYRSPWNAPSQGMVSGSGFVIEGNRILTNAHVVANSAFLQVQFNEWPERYRAYVEWVGHDCDLAILKVENEALLNHVVPLEVGEELAKIQDEVFVFGYPIGGEDLSITRGILSRTEMLPYSHGGRYLLCSQIDAPINPGNSGGPVFSNGKVVGVVHMGYRQGQNLGYMIPIPIIRHFLKDVESGQYEGFPLGGVIAKPMESPALREFYRMDSDQSGVLITYVNENSSFYGKILPGDVVLSIEGVQVENNGNTALYGKHWIFFAHLLHQKYYGEIISLKVLRDGEEIPLSIYLDKERKARSLVPGIEYEKRPTYYVKGGLVFQPLNFNYLFFSMDYEDIPSHLLYYQDQGKVKGGREEVIVISRVLPDDVNTGYQKVSNEVVERVNGKKIHRMSDLIEAFESNEERFHQILTEQDSEIILGREDVELRSPEILGQYLIPSDRSEDLKGKK